MADKTDLTMGMANAVDIFVVKPKEAGTGYDFYAFNDTGIGEIVTSPTATTAIRLDVIEQNALEYQSDGTIKVTLTQYQNDVKFRKLLADNRPTTVGTRPDKTMIDGQKILGSAGRFSIVQIVYGNLLNDFETTPANKKRLIITAFGNIIATSGSFTGKDGEYNQPTYEFQSSSVPTGFTLTVPKGAYDTDIITAPSADTTLNAGESVKEAYLQIKQS